MDVCIKNINDEGWRTFKSESIRHGLKTGEFFNRLVEEHEVHCSNANWKKALYGEKTCKGILSADS
ncbi:MAG: hypothetical protein AABX13_04060 [Nanoarchaeota archaeon]